MGNGIASLLYVKGGEKPELSLITAKKIIEKTGFSYGQIEQFWTRFLALDSRNVLKLNKDDLNNFSDLKDNPLKERIIEVMMQYSKGRDIDFSTFVKIISIFRTVSDSSTEAKKEKRRMDKLKFAFKIYDIDNDSKINQSDLQEILKIIMGNKITTEKIIQIAEKVITEFNCEEKQIDYKQYCAFFKNDDINLKMSIPFLKRQK